MDTVLIVITLGSFAAALVNAAFATGGVYLLLAASSAVLPLPVAVPLQSAFAFSSLVSRVVWLRRHIDWSIVMACSAGAAIGVYLGLRVFVSLPEATMALLLGCLLLLFIWFPRVDWRLPFRHPFFMIGGAHAFIATIFGVGALLQPAMLRTRLLKLQITSTLAACMIIMDVFKIAGYVAVGFDYLAYLPHIVLATLAGIAGTWLGRHLTHAVSERLFRLVFKWLITLVALRLLYRGWSLY